MKAQRVGRSARQRSSAHRFRVVGVLVIMLTALLWRESKQSGRVQAVSSSIVISQVYGGGGNSGATYRNDFIELFNRGTTTVSVTGWSVQYNSSSSTTGAWQVTNLSGSIPPGGYYLIQEAQGSGGTVSLPTPDATGTIAMSATVGKVALVSTTTALAVQCPSGAGIIDVIGFGAATNCAEGTPTANLSNTTAALRGGNGCTETDNNSSDFSIGTPNPRNSATPAAPCGGGDSAPSVSSSVPANGATNVAITTNIDITFSESVSLDAGWFSISCVTSGAHTAVQSGGPTTWTLNPDVDFAFSEICTVTIVATAVHDSDSIDPPDTMVANHVFSFTTASGGTPGPDRIRDIQGSGHISPKNSLAVTNVPGVVTAKTTNGFWMQDPTPDANDATSEGIFVFTSSAPTVNTGDSVLVSGTVKEFRAGCDPSCATTASAYNNLTTTELISPTIISLSSGNPLPPPVVIGAGGRVPPSSVIDDDSTTNHDVELSGTFDHTTDGIDFYESLEGMRVQVNNAVVVGPTTSFGEIVVVGDGGGTATLRTGRGGIVIRPSDFNPERIILDDVITATPQAKVNDTFTTSVIGVLDYSFANYKLLITAPLSVVSGGLIQETTSPQAANELAIATFNVENLDPGDGVAKFNTLASLLVNNLRSPDIVTVEEVQDNNGATNDSVVDATTTINTLISAITAAGGPTYQFRQVNPVDDQDGGEPGGNIRQVFLFRTDRGLSFVDRPGGGSTVPDTVQNVGGKPQLQFSPGRIDPTNSAFNSSRKPLAGEFIFNGQRLFVIGNHWNSKGGDQPLFGRFQPPVLNSETQRQQQATIVRAFIDQIRALDPSALIAVNGDLNDFQFSNPVTTLTSGGAMVALMNGLPEAERYSYVFDGNAQSLDHTLASPALNAALTSFDVVHVNSEFPVASRVSDHDPQVARFLLTFPAPSGLRVVSTTTSEVNLAWDDALGETTYNLAWSGDSGATWSVIGGPAADVVTYLHNGRTPNTRYYYALQACNAVTCSPWSAAVAAVTGGGVTPPAPTNLRSGATTNTTIDVLFDFVDGGYIPQVAWATNPAGGYSFADLTTDAHQHTITGLPAGTPVYIWVRLCSGAVCSIWAGALTAVTSGGVAPASPANFHPGTVTDTSLTVEWDDTTGETHYHVAYSSDSGATWSVVSVPADGISYTLSGLAPGSAVYFSLRACNGNDYVCSPYLDPILMVTTGGALTGGRIPVQGRVRRVAPPPASARPASPAAAAVQPPRNAPLPVRPSQPPAPSRGGATPPPAQSPTPTPVSPRLR